jgi:ABC-2 type transport system permease protein
MNMVAGGEQSGYGILEASEQLWMFSQFYGLGAREGWRRVDELIDAVGLGEQRHQRAWAVLDDRERYRMLKYIYVSPSSFLTVLIGRGVARLAVGAMGAGITLAVGVIFLGVPFDLLAVDWPLLVVVLVLGVITISALALVMAAICLQTRQESWDYPEVVVGALFLVVGAVFPLSVLPLPLQVFGLISPLTWWIAGVRQALFPGGPSSIGGPGSLWQQLSGQLNPTAVQVVVALLVTGAVVTLASAILFRSGEERAKDRGLIDRTTGS